MEIFYKYAKNKQYSKGYLEARKSLKQKGYSPTIYGALLKWIRQIALNGNTLTIQNMLKHLICH